MIEAKGIVKNYGNLRVLKGVDILIKKGEVVAITGKSGAGKSTLLHILGTLDQSDEGTILFEDNDISKYNNKEFAKFRNSEIGFIFQIYLYITVSLKINIESLSFWLLLMNVAMSDISKC